MIAAFAAQPFAWQAVLVGVLVGCAVLLALALLVIVPASWQWMHDALRPRPEDAGLVRWREGDELIPTKFERWYGLIPPAPPVGTLVDASRVRRRIHVVDANDEAAIHRAVCDMGAARERRRLTALVEIGTPRVPVTQTSVHPITPSPNRKAHHAH